MSDSTSTSFRWENPPEDARINWSDVIAVLKTQPYTWALVAENTSRVTPQHLKNRWRDDIEVRSYSADLPVGRVKLYARWVGDAA